MLIRFLFAKIFPPLKKYKENKTKITATTYTAKNVFFAEARFLRTEVNRQNRDRIVPIKNVFDKYFLSPVIEFIDFKVIIYIIELDPAVI